MISAYHKQQYRDYYAARTIAPSPNQWLVRVEQLAADLKVESIIDYGCGAARSFSSFCSLPVANYDPGIPEFSVVPPPADLVVSIHMLEHVEPQYVDCVIAHMFSLARKAVLLVVSCEPSTKTLPDGSPWHSFVMPAHRWADKLSDFTPVPVLKDRPGAEYAAVKFV
jgi:hypothetical protein